MSSKSPRVYEKRPSCHSKNTEAVKQNTLGLWRKVKSTWRQTHDKQIHKCWGDKSSILNFIELIWISAWRKENNSLLLKGDIFTIPFFKRIKYRKKWGEITGLEWRNLHPYFQVWSVSRVEDKGLLNHAYGVYISNVMKITSYFCGLPY